MPDPHSDPYKTADEPTAVGIDLGTTFCAVARADEKGRLECYLIDEDRPLMPSALYFGDQIYAGREALDRGYNDAEAVYEVFKRDMGQPHFHRKVQRHWVPPEVLSALVLDEIRRRLRGKAPDASRAVITVPAYFDERRRKATFEAGKLAGFEVLNIVNEPVAAALAEFHRSGLLDSLRDQQAKVLVYDLGGGTFDVSILEIAGSEITTLASDGDIRLGGRDLDELLVDYVSEQFLEKHGVDPRADFGYAQRLWSLAEEAKRALSTETSTTVVCSFAGMRLGIEISRSTFEQLIAPFVERTMITTQDALQQAGVRWKDLDQVLMVGGSSRIPAISRRLQEAAGKPPVLSHEPDLAVAMGAALFAKLSDEGESGSYSVVNVNAHSLGIAGVDVKTGQPINRIIIPRGSRLPAVKRQKFVTKSPGQKTIDIKIVEGENENPKYCVSVGKCIVRLSPDLPARTEVAVTCRVGENGTLSVACVVPLTKESAHVEIRREGLLELEPLAVWRDRLLRGISAAPEPTVDLPMVPEAVAPNILDHGAVVKRIDYLCQEIGGACTSATVPPEVLPAQRYLQSAHREYSAVRHLLGEVRNALALAHDKLERSKLQAAVAAIRGHLKETEQMLIYARIAFGVTCIQSQCTLPAVQKHAGEVQELLDKTRSWVGDAPA